jgi:hypothetical protein
MACTEDGESLDPRRGVIMQGLRENRWERTDRGGENQSIFQTRVWQEDAGHITDFEKALAGGLAIFSLFRLHSGEKLVDGGAANAQNFRGPGFVAANALEHAQDMAPL